MGIQDLRDIFHVFPGGTVNDGRSGEVFSSAKGTSAHQTGQIFPDPFFTRHLYVLQENVSLPRITPSMIKVSPDLAD